MSLDSIKRMSIGKQTTDVDNKVQSLLSLVFNSLVIQVLIVDRIKLLMFLIRSHPCMTL